MCLSKVININQPDTVILDFVSKIEVEGSLITMTDIMGEQKTVEGSIVRADLTGGKVEISCPA